MITTKPDFKAAQGDQGLELALTNHYDLVILDLNFPVIDGLDVCKQLREQSNHHVPIIMLTARDSIEDKILASLLAQMIT